MEGKVNLQIYMKRNKIIQQQEQPIRGRVVSWWIVRKLCTLLSVLISVTIVNLQQSGFRSSAVFVVWTFDALKHNTVSKTLILHKSIRKNGKQGGAKPQRFWEWVHHLIVFTHPPGFFFCFVKPIVSLPFCFIPPAAHFKCDSIKEKVKRILGFTG